jgi:predicted nucleic acid-binding protein
LTVYADASLIVAAFSSEPASDAAIAWLEGLAAGDLFTSKWCETEVASAMAIKTRTGDLKPADLKAVIDAVSAMLTESATSIAIDGRHFDAATDLIRRSEKPLRAGDALHLAIGQASGAVIWTLDRGMAAAGQAFGMDVRLLA